MGEINEKKIGKDIRLTFKEDEQDIRRYLESKSSATCFLKDLARIEMQREKKMLESAYANDVLEQIMQLLNQKEPKAPVFNLTANFEGAIPMAAAQMNDNKSDEEIDIEMDEFILKPEDITDI